ncbi:ATP-binding cassette domain-containing protein [Hymenobacter sp. PAMC 26628]|uniref:ATP-binding cassette domain-containing protein n=1 Tax=Hymenobacter sp. PAMC 26628 TaxID=1484118 RepID=UPI0009020782|nr:ATP-binding cassette domain-containing protein [Hymenobacter sp. PAMC 26628]
MIDFHLLKALHTTAGPRTLDVRLSLAPGELVALSGPSGAGKTTLLRLLAGLDRPDSGFVRTENQVWYDHDTRQWLPPQRRPLGFVFQDYALFPNMTVRENLAFAAAGQPGAGPLVAELLDLLELTALASRHPGALSGGQQQRVALARALARRPRLLLLDEPLAALDLPTRLRLQQVLADAHQRFGLTTLLISHDPAEIVRLAHRVVELDLGQVRRVGPPLLEPPGPVAGRVVAVLPGGRLRVQLAGGPTLVDVPAPPGRTYAPGDELALTVSVE